jgi:CBS domain-containing protein
LIWSKAMDSRHAIRDGVLAEEAMHARQVMTRPVVTIPADATVFAAAGILLGSGISGAPVVDADGTMIGIVSEADLMNRPEIGTVPAKSLLQRLLGNDEVCARDYIRSHSHHVADVMTREVVAADEHTDLRDLARLMQRHRVRRIPIVRDGKLVGVVSRANLLRGLLSREPFPVEGEISDERIREGVSAELESQGWSGRSAASVIVDQGVVHLWGHVEGKPIKEAMGIAAENVPGVRRVVNHLAILPESMPFGV